MAKVTAVQQVKDDLRSMVDKLVEYDNEVISDLLRRVGAELRKPAKKKKKENDDLTSWL